MIGCQNGREESASFARQPFFLLDNQVIRLFHLKDSLIILGTVTYVVCGRMCFWAMKDQLENYWLAIYLEMTAGWKRMCLGNKSWGPLL